MTDEHDEVARMLREQGTVKAPPDLADAVMREVRRAPRRAGRQRELIARAARFGAAAAALVAIGVGVSRLDFGGGGMSSSAGGGAGSSVAGSALERAADSVKQSGAEVYGASVTDGRARFDIPEPAARRLLGTLWSADKVVDGRIVINMSAAEYEKYVPRLRRAAVRGAASAGPQQQPIRVILRRVR